MSIAMVTVSEWYPNVSWNGVDEFGRGRAFYRGAFENLFVQAGSNPIDNRNTIYDRYPDDIEFNQGIECSKAIIRGKPGWYLAIGEDTYDIEPQVDLGLVDGVAVATRADFVFWRNKSDSTLLPIAVYTDGFEYHRDRIADDLEKRMAIGKSGRFLVWSLAWDDAVTFAELAVDPELM